MRAFILLALNLLIAPCASQAQSCNQTASEQAWTKGSGCHSLHPNTTGGAAPVLRGLFERTAGHSPGFIFSAAFRRASFAWNDQTFDDFVADPQRMVPGTTMAFSGLRNIDQRRAIACLIRQNSQKSVPAAP